MLNFFEDVSTAYENGYLDKTLAENSYSFYLCRWWEALKSYVDQERSATKKTARCSPVSRGLHRRRGCRMR